MNCWLRIKSIRHWRTWQKLPCKMEQISLMKNRCKMKWKRGSFKDCFPWEYPRCYITIAYVKWIADFASNQSGIEEHGRSYPAKWSRFLWWKAIEKWSKNRTALKVVFFFENIHRDQVLSLLLSMPNVLLTSHQAFLTNEALKNIAEVTLQNLADFFDGKPLQNEVKTGQL